MNHRRYREEREKICTKLCSSHKGDGWTASNVFSTYVSLSISLASDSSAIISQKNQSK